MTVLDAIVVLPKSSDFTTGAELLRPILKRAKPSAKSALDEVPNIQRWQRQGGERRIEFEGHLTRVKMAKASLGMKAAENTSAAERVR